MGSESKSFRDCALNRILEYEAFLDACGITPVAGSELEFHFMPQASPNYRKLSWIEEFKDSPLVEGLKPEDAYNVGEVVPGQGPKAGLGKIQGRDTRRRLCVPLSRQRKLFSRAINTEWILILATGLA